jgi:hypothetical protein
MVGWNANENMHSNVQSGKGAIGALECHPTHHSSQATRPAQSKVTKATPENLSLQMLSGKHHNYMGYNWPL